MVAAERYLFSVKKVILGVASMEWMGVFVDIKPESEVYVIISGFQCMLAGLQVGVMFLFIRKWMLQNFIVLAWT